MFRQIFGNENAATDDLLEECYVAPPGVVLEKPILIGKWGTGKTGLLLHRNSGLSRLLRAKSEDSQRIWYLDETGVQLQTLKHIERECGEDRHLTKRVLEDLWRSEIIRTCASIIHELRDHYGNRKDRHWVEFDKIFSKTTKKTVWDLIPSAIGAVASKERAEGANELFAKIKSMHDDATLRVLNKCLYDIKDYEIQPVVAIEPIETPTSEVEEKTDLAQLLVTCLLNVYYKFFQTSERQRIRVEISIPWHRYNRDQVGEPQKLYPFIGRFRWTKSSMRSFINKRIEWEFKRVRRSFTEKGPKDAWSALFPETVRNSNTGDEENSFDYIVRHTQYRIRDLLRLSRECIEHEAVNQDIQMDDVLSSKNGIKISEKSIRAAVIKVCKSTSIERILEGDRRFPGLSEHADKLRGIAVPFSVDDVKKRFFNSDGTSGVDVIKALDNLWNCGVVGVQITAGTDAALKQLKASLESGTQSRFSAEQKKGIFYLFEHSSDKNLIDIINTFDGINGKGEHNDISVALILHPMLFEHLDARVNEKHPIGV